MISIMEQSWNNHGLPKLGDELVYKSQIITEDIRRKIESGFYSGKLPTLRDFASMYKVNIKTVSKSLDVLEKSGILELTQGRGIFVSSRKKKTDSMIVALFLKSHGHVNEQLYNYLVKGLRRHHYFPILISDDDSRQSSKKEIDRVINLNPCATVIERGLGEFDYAYLKEREKDLRHIIFVIRNESGIDFHADYILSDPWYAAYQVTDYLLKKGHEKIMFLTNKMEMQPDAYCWTDHCYLVNGYRMALEERGMASKEMIFFDADDTEGDSSGFEQILSDRRSRPTAIFASMDYRIISKYPIIRRLGLKVPGDLDIIGYFNTPWSRGPELFFSSVSIEEKEIAKAVVNRICEGNCMNIRSVIKPKLIIRRFACNG